MRPSDSLLLSQDFRQALEGAVRVIVEIAQPQLVILFGSWAEGAPGPDSDVDLLVVAETKTRARLAASLRRALKPVLSPHQFDLLVYQPKQWEEGRNVIGFVTYEADQFGVRLYERAA